MIVQFEITLTGTGNQHIKMKIEKIPSTYTLPEINLELIEKTKLSDASADWK